jgi:type IV secretion system protein VirB6
MKNIAKILIITIVLGFANPSYSADFADDDSCIPGITMIARLIANLGSFGLFSAYSASFYMVGDGAEDGGRCATPSEDVNYCFTTVAGIDANGISIDEKHCKTLKDGDRLDSYATFLPPALIRAKNKGDKVCIQFMTAIGWSTIGCKYRPDPARSDLGVGCFAGQSCAKNGVRNSRSFFPVMGTVVQCVKESLDRVFIDQSACAEFADGKVNMFPEFQMSMRDIVRGALVLYVIFFGMKIALGSEMPRKGEVFMFLMKFILVLYFSVGISSGIDGDGKAQYTDGVTTFLKPSVETISASLAKMVFSAGGASGLCVYKETDYKKGFEYLALWDSIDCRVAYYLGIDPNKLLGAAAGIVAATMMIPVSLVLAALFAFQFMFFVFSLLFGVFVVSIAVYFTHLFIIALIAINILIYVAPIFVPMALFKETKGYYDAWLKLLISYMLQPMIVTAFMALMLTIFDQAMYGTCTFNESSITIGGKDVPIFDIEAPTDEPEKSKCEDSFGYQVSLYKSGAKDPISIVSAIFFNLTFLKASAAGEMMQSLLTLTLFAFLFYSFVELLGRFAADLTGGPALGNLAARPTAIFDAFGNRVANKIKSKLGGKGKKGNEKGSGAHVTRGGGAGGGGGGSGISRGGAGGGSGGGGGADV